MVQGAVVIEQTGVHRAPRERLERDGADELRGCARHHDVHLGTGLREQTGKPGALVARDAAGNSEQHTASSEGPKSGVGHGRLVREEGCCGNARGVQRTPRGTGPTPPSDDEE